MLLFPKSSINGSAKYTTGAKILLSSYKYSDLCTKLERSFQIETDIWMEMNKLFFAMKSP